MTNTTKIVPLPLQTPAPSLSPNSQRLFHKTKEIASHSSALAMEIAREGSHSANAAGIFELLPLDIIGNVLDYLNIREVCR